MEKKINLEEIFNKYRQPSPNLPGMVDIEYFKSTINVMICEGISQALELAAKNVKLREQADIYDNGESELDSECSVAFGSVTDCYNNTLPSKITVSISSILDTIKQIE